MINQVNGNNVSGMNFQRFGEPKSLSKEQKSQLEELLSKYDPAAMTEEDYMALGDAMKELGVTPSGEVRTMLEDAGFSPPEKPGGPQGMRPSQAQQDEFITMLSDKMKETGITADQIEEVLNYIQENGLFMVGNFVDKNG